jgi:ABC-type antimicrobial peptide transport system permease subunit
VTSVLITLVGSLATLLALVGVYGVISYGVSRRAREIGVRIALGAPSRHVLALVMRQGGRIVAVGIAVGLALAAGASQVLRGMLFGLSALDPPAFLGTAAVVALAALLAMYQPARRAARIDPAVTLRAE